MSRAIAQTLDDERSSAFRSLAERHLDASYLASSHDREALRQALARLRPDDRVVLALRYYRDLKVDDIALALDIPPGTVMSRIHHALRRLRMVLDETGEKDAFR